MKIPKFEVPQKDGKRIPATTFREAKKTANWPAVDLVPVPLEAEVSL